MEKTYTISQISKLLGLTNDAIRFYEKKGLVHPTTNPHNNYRMYMIHRNMFLGLKKKKKINYIQSLYLQIKTDKNIEIATFPTSYILFESEDSDEFFTHKIRHITTDEFVLCSIFKKYDHTLNQQATYVTLETDIASNLQLSLDLQTINLTKCIHMTCAMNNKTINKTTINKLLEYAKINNLNYASYFLIKEIPLTFYHDKENYYAEIYLPII